MIWDAAAEEAIRKVPFFVRKKVRQRVEAFVSDRGEDRVTLGDVEALRQQFLSKGGMESQIKGYEVSVCFGQGACPNSLGSCAELVRGIEAIFREADLLSFLKARVKGDLKFHHEFRVSVSECPNACSRPQITDIGIIGAAMPGVTQAPCSFCGLCERACPDQAIGLADDGPQINPKACLACGKCVRVCPSGTLDAQATGYRVLLGGCLGRHPRLGMEVPGILSQHQVLDLVRRCLAFYKENSREGQRFSHILESPSQVL